MNPFETDQVTNADKLVWRAEPLSAVTGSFVDIDRPDVQLLTWKGAEDGRGSILRFYNAGESPVRALVPVSHACDSRKHIGPAEQKTIVAPLRLLQGALILSLKPHEIRTVRIMGISAYPGG